MSKTVVIVGGGFSGTLAAVHLLNATSSRPSRIILVEPAEVGRGLAYGTSEHTHLLNVPAGSMSAFGNDSGHFLRFAQSRLPATVGADFLPRKFYGDYLQWLLQEAIAKKSNDCEFTIIRDTVIDIREQQDYLKVYLANAGELLADRVLLATGNAPSADLSLASDEFFQHSRRYIRNPWDTAALAAVDKQQPVLLIGTGLTAVDVALSLHAHKFDQHIYALSRHGLTPLAHRGLSAEPHEFHLPAALLHGTPTHGTSTIAALLRELRQLAATGLRDDDNWRSIIAALRPHIPELWQMQLSERERRKFLRHVSIYWDVHRHRLAPVVAASLYDQLLLKRLTLYAGRIVGLQDQRDIVTVTWRARSSSEQSLLRVGTVINCTGPCSNLQHSKNLLLATLAQRGVIAQDQLGLGLEVADNYAVIGADRSVSSSLYYAGPFLKAKYWEATAVPELRVHVERAVQSLLVSLRDAH